MTSGKQGKRGRFASKIKREERLLVYVTPEIKSSLREVSAKKSETVSQYVFAILRDHMEEINNV